jgi:hypothetical protein
LRKKEKRNREDPEKENEPADPSAKLDVDDASEFLGVDSISLDAFRDALEAAGDIKVFCARVDISALPNSGADDAKEAADALAEIVWETIGYRFLYVTLISIIIYYNNQFFTKVIIQLVEGSEDCCYNYHCAQLESRRHNSKKNSDASKQRDKGQMDMFECGGWVNIWAAPEESELSEKSLLTYQV